jgi:hypothetical protein
MESSSVIQSTIDKLKARQKSNNGRNKQQEASSLVSHFYANVKTIGNYDLERGNVMFCLNIC